MKKVSWLSLLSVICLFFPITANAIKIVEVVPASGPIGFPVIIKGENFNLAPEIKTTVKFGKEEATEVEVLSDTEIRAITPVSRSGPVDVTVKYFNEEREVESDTLPNGFAYDGFFVFNPEKNIGKEEGIYDADSGLNIPIQLDIPVTSLSLNDKFPSIYIKPITRKILLDKGFNIDRIIGDEIYEIKVRNEAGDILTRFDDSIIIHFLIDSPPSPMPNVLLLSDSTQNKVLSPIPTEVISVSQSQTEPSPPVLIGRITHLSEDNNYLAAGINHAPTINTLGIMSVAGSVSITGESTEISLTGADDSDDDHLTFIITELPTGGYLHDGETPIFGIPFAITSNIVTYTPQTGYFGTDQFQFKVSDSAMESETQVVHLDVSLVPPKVTDIAPRIGTTLGGITVMITGENFVPGIKVYFGEQEATRVMFISPNLLAAVTPPVLPAGQPASGFRQVSVKVINPDGKSAVLGSDSVGIATLGNELANVSVLTLYSPPAVTGISPESGPMTGGTSITISGENFINGATIYIGATEATDVQVNLARVLQQKLNLAPRALKML